jgi:ribosomal protein S18 acetylase RimI-like enzyme
MLLLRPATAFDVPYLVSLRVKTMTEHLQRAGQWLTQEEHEARAMSELHACSIVLLDERPTGMVKTLRTQAYWEIAQVQIEPDRQGNGMGTTLLTEIISDARRVPVPVRLSVLKGNRAKTLYERLGFKVIGEDASSYQMQVEV